MELGPVEVLRIILGLMLIFFLPGYLLVKALFPGRNELDKEYNVIHEIGLGMGLSIVISILTGFFLGSLHQLIGFRVVDGKEKGYFDTPYIVASLLTICLLLFIVAWYRGAIPWLGKLHPSLARVPASERPEARKKRMDALIIKLWDLSREREKLRKEVRDCERRARSHGREMRAHYKKKLEEGRKKLADVDAEIKALEQQRAEELAGLEEEKERKRRIKEGKAEEGFEEKRGRIWTWRRKETKEAEGRKEKGKEPEGGGEEPEAREGAGEKEEAEGEGTGKGEKEED